MLFQQIMDRIIKARADVLHAGRLLAQWDSRAGRSPDPNEYVLLVNLIRQADETLDSVVSGMVKESVRLSDTEGVGLPRSRRRPALNRSRSF